jgi:hypothetical protein
LHIIVEKIFLTGFIDLRDELPSGLFGQSFRPIVRRCEARFDPGEIALVEFVLMSNTRYKIECLADGGPLQKVNRTDHKLQQWNWP